MPQRFLRPGITTSDGWNSVSFPAQSLFVRILTLVDDWGRYDGRVAVLHGQCFALRSDIKPQQTAAFRSELHNAGLIQVYTADGKDYVQVTKWQERARGTHSKFPDPPPEKPPQESAADGSGPQEKDASLATTPSPLHPIPSPSPTTPSPLAAAAAGFEDFWQAYPRKAGKGDAEKAWVKLKLAPKLPEILTAIRAAKVSLDWTKEAGQFIPHPATWLNRRGWEDQLQPARPPTSAGLDKSRTIPLKPSEQPPIWRP
jgi:hypothetical protein